MKELLNSANIILKQSGYRKRGASFWKNEDGIYKLINFQAGAHGGGYFFVNVCVHFVGLPTLISNTLSIIEQPKEYECILRKRIEQIVKNDQISSFRKGLVSIDDHVTIEAVLNSLPNEVENWLNKYVSFETIISASYDEILNMLTVVPLLQRKAYHMLKFFCYLKLGEKNKANEFYDYYLAEDIPGVTLIQVDNYLKKLI